MKTDKFRFCPLCGSPLVYPVAESEPAQCGGDTCHYVHWKNRMTQKKTYHASEQFNNAKDCQNQNRTKNAINDALDIFHRRWVLRLIWELRRGPMTFRQLQEACGEISPTVLNNRLTELRKVNIVDRGDEGGYQLTEHGRSLLRAMGPMLDWATQWHADVVIKNQIEG